MDEQQQQIDSVGNLTGISELARGILSHLEDAESLRNAGKVSPYWRSIIRNGRLWKRLIEKNVANDKVWAKLVQKLQNPFSREPNGGEIQEEILHDTVEAYIRDLDSRWQRGQFTVGHYFSNGMNSSYCHHDEIGGGSIFQGPRIWNLESGLCVQTYAGFDSVSCHHSLRDSECIFRFDDRIIVFACVDGRIHIWDRKDPDQSGPCNRLEWANSTISRLEIGNKLMVAADCFSSRLAVYGIHSPRDVRLIESFSMLCKAFYYSEFASMYIGSFGKKHINIRFLHSRAYELVKTMEVCADLKYKDRRMVTVSRLMKKSSKRWRMTLWDVDGGTRLRTIELDSHGQPLFCFDRKRLVVARRELAATSTTCIDVIEMENFLNKNIPDKDLCVSVVLEEPFENCIQSLSIDEFRIKFCFWPDGNVIIWNFQSPAPIGTVR